MNRLTLTKQNRQYLFMYVVIAHFFIILMVCINSSVDSYTSFYEIKKQGLNKFVLDYTAATVNAPGISEYATIAGIDAGYGFFAPNVASEYILEFKLYDKQKQLTDVKRLPAFKNKESIMRYSTMLGSFQEKLLAMHDPRKLKSLKIRYLDVVIKSIGRKYLSQDASLSKVKGTLYLYDFPSLSAYNVSNTATEELIPFTKFDILRK